MPGGRYLSTVCEIEVTWAVAVLMSTCGWKKIFTTEIPASDCDSTCSMSLTELESWRS